MALTIDQALQVGQLAIGITTLNVLIAGVQTAINNGDVITEISVRTLHPDGTTDAMHGEISLSTSESGIFNDVVNLYQSRLDALNAQLAALVP